MVRKDLRLRGSYECHLNELRGSIRALLSRCSRLLNGRPEVTTINDSDRKAVLEKAFGLQKLRSSVNIKRTKLSGREIGHSRQPSPVLVLFRS